MSRWNPYAHAGSRFPEWVIRFTDLHGIPELMCWDRRVILIGSEPGQRVRRSCMAHALGHLELMHRGSVFDRKEEEAANRWAAGMLIDIDQLADAAQWHDWQVGEGLAAELHVDIDTLVTRITMAKSHPAEAAYLRARRDRMEQVA